MTGSKRRRNSPSGQKSRKARRTSIGGTHHSPPPDHEPTQSAAAMPLESSISDFFSPVGPLTTQNTGDTSSNIIMYDMDALGPVDRHILTLDASQSVDLSGPSNPQEMEAAEIPASTMFSPVTGLKFSTSHEKMDEEVMEELRQIPIRPSRSLIVKLVVLGCKEIHSKFGGNFVIGWLDKYPDLFPIIDNCFDSGSFKELRELSLFWPPPPQEEEVSHVPDDPGDASAAKVTELAWEREYRGSAVDALWSHMNHVYERSHDKSSRSGVILYANYSAIVQSSGTGKSRMVDELAKRELVIPMNLRSYTSKKAFPPSDTVIYDYFRPTEDVTQLTALSRSYAFVTAVLNQTTEVIQGFEREGLEREDYVAAFRTYMTEGQTMEKQADKRVKFYEDAIEQAEKMHKEWSAAAGGRPIHTTPKKSAPGKANDASNVAAPTPDGLGTEAVNVAARELVKALRGDDKSRKLALVITFDEAHTLSETKHSNSRGRWSYFSEVRRVLRSLKGERLFALFLSTTGKLAQFVPAREYDSSARVVNGVFTIPVPFTDTGFDQFVVEIEVDGSFTLEQATQVAHMVTYGRPLFATRYFPQDDQVNASPQDNTSTQENESSQETPSSQSSNPSSQLSNPSSQSSQRKGKSSSRRKPAVKDLNRVRDDIVRFAMDKLLCRFPGHALEGGANPLGPSETLACLSQRLPIEFMSTTFLQDGEEMKQVESHMRVALKVGEGFRTLSTVTASEPILVEAAIKAMESFSPIKALNFVADGFAVHKGNIGELVGILSFLLARDQVFRLEDSHVLSLTAVLSAWLKPPPEDSKGSKIQHDNILEARPAIFADEKEKALNRTLGETFAKSKIHCTHFIKVHDFRLLRPGYLLALACRGVGVLCANSQGGIDAYFPFTYEGSSLSVDNMGVVFLQIKNDQTYSANMVSGLYDSMDPYKLNYFTKPEDAKVPLIRIVMAVAGRTPALKVRPPPPPPKEDTNDKDKQQEDEKKQEVKTGPFTAYDIWVSGMTSDIYGPVAEGTEGDWAAVLGKRHDWEKLYATNPEHRYSHLRRAANPAAAARHDHLRWLSEKDFNAFQ